MTSKAKKRKYSQPELNSDDDGRISGLSEISSDTDSDGQISGNLSESDGRISGLSIISSDSDNGQIGKGVRTRRQAAKENAQVQSPQAAPAPSSPTPGPSRTPPMSPTPSIRGSPIAGPSTRRSATRSPSPIPGSPSPIPGPSTRRSTTRSRSPSPPAAGLVTGRPAQEDGFFDSETKVFENEDFSLFIQKQEHQRQKVFRLEDHLFVMRVKLKNHKKRPPLLRSVRKIIEETMSVMVEDLKSHYDPQEQNIVYVTIKQPGICCKYNCN
jgi:hypothetical protein